MPNILIRDLDDELDKALRVRAAEHGLTREMEIKTILQAAVKKGPVKRSLAEALTRIPKIEDLGILSEREKSAGRTTDLSL